MDSPMKSLDDIAIACETDRASIFTRTYGKPHDYARHYDRLFSPIRFDELKVLEIGVGGGEGIRMWLDYFANAKEIIGVDIVHDTNEWDVPGKKGRYTFCQGDQGHDVFWKCFIATYGIDWDIVIDDGGHASNQIITTFKHLWPVLKPGGFYAVEDLGVAYGGSMFVPDGWPNHFAWLFEKIHGLNQGYDIDSMHFSKELVVMRKAQ